MLHAEKTLRNQETTYVSALPAEFDVHGSRYAAWVLIIFSIVFGAEALVHLAAAALKNDSSIVELQDWILGPIGIVFFIWGVNQFFIKGRLTVDANRVYCFYKSLAGHDNWSDPIASYSGVRVTTENDQSESGDSTQYLIWLWHKKRKKRVRLYQAGLSDHLDEQLRFYSEMFGLPVMKS